MFGGGENDLIIYVVLAGTHQALKIISKETDSVKQ